MRTNHTNHTYDAAGAGAGGGGSEGSEEFLTFKTPILRIAAHYRLVPVIEYGDTALEG